MMKIAKFGQDYRQLATLIEQSWPQEHKNHIDYTPRYLEYLLNAPDIDCELTLGAYRGKTLIGFVLGKQKMISIAGIPYKTLFTTLATTDPKCASSFPYLKMKDHLSRYAIAAGYDAVCGYAAWGIKNNEIEILYAQRQGYQCFRVSSFSSLVGGLSANMETSGGEVAVRDFQPKDVIVCGEIVKNSVLTHAFRELPSRESLEYRLTPSSYGNTKIIEANNSLGFVNYSILRFQYPNFQRTLAVVYNLFLHAFTPQQSRRIITGMYPELREAGVQGISIPNTGYFDAKFLKEEGFREPPFQCGKTNLYITFFEKKVEIRDGLSFYMEIM